MKALKELKQKILSQPFFSSPLYLKYQHFVVPGIVLVISLLISGLVTVPQFMRLFETFKKIDELNAQKSFLEQKTAMLEAVDVEEYRANLDTALLALPVDKDVPGVTGEVLVALSGSGMVLDGITFAGSSGEASGNVSEFSLRMEVVGSPESLKNFMDRIKLSPRIVKMVAVEVGRDKSSFLTASVSLVTLYQPLPQSIGTVEEKVPEITKDNMQTLADIRAKADAQPQAATGATDVEGKLNPFAP